MVATIPPAKIEVQRSFDNKPKDQEPQRFFAGAVLARRFGIRRDRAILLADLAGLGGA